jgi:hypothetical protein
MIPGACLRQQVFGNFLGKAVDFFNPLSELQEFIDLFQGEDAE